MTYLQRKKLAFMSIVNKVKGFIRTVSGVPPLTLSNCVDEDSLINYTINGNSVQNGTPTPDTLIEVENVGERTKNLIGDYNYTDQKTQYWSVISAKEAFTLKQGVTYTISFDTPSTNKIVYYWSFQKTTQGFMGVRLNGQRKSLTITPTEDITSSSIINVSSALVEGDTVGLCSNCMIEEGTTASAYEPYGYKIPIVCRGKNFFNVYGNFIKQPNCLAQTTSETEITITYETQVWGDYMPITLLPGTYTISYDVINKTETAKISFKAWNNFTTAVYTRANAPETVGTRCNISFTLTKQAKYIQFYTQTTSGVGSSYTIGNIQIEEGTTVTEYEPYVEPVTTSIYLDEPLKAGETLINPVKLPTVKGTTIYTVDTTVQPSNIRATYYSTVKE